MGMCFSSVKASDASLSASDASRQRCRAQHEVAVDRTVDGTLDGQRVAATVLRRLHGQSVRPPDAQEDRLELVVAVIAATDDGQRRG